MEEEFMECEDCTKEYLAEELEACIECGILLCSDCLGPHELDQHPELFKGKG